MKNDAKKTVIIGTILVALGAVFLLALLNVLDSIGVYNFLLPIVLIVAGFSLVSSQDKSFQYPKLGLGLLVFGLVSILVRFDILSTQFVDGALGLILVITGLVLIMRIGDKNAS